MAIVGFTYNKINGVRNVPKVSGNIEITHNISIENVELTKFNLSGSSSGVLKVTFRFDIKYGSDLGEIVISGDVLYSDTQEIMEESVKGFESDKKLNPMVHAQIVQFVYSKTIVKAIDFSDLLGLPAPIPLPKIQMNKGPRVVEKKTENNSKKEKENKEELY